MKVIYTEAAEQELQTFRERQKRLLEELIAEKKFIYGDESLEITASDIKETSEQIRAYRPASYRFRSTLLIGQLYIALGVLLMVGSYFYPLIERMLVENRLQAMLVLVGAITVVTGLFALYFYKLRQKRYEEMERGYQPGTRPPTLGPNHDKSSHTTEVTSTHFTERLVTALIEFNQKGMKHNLEWGLNDVTKRIEAALSEQLLHIDPELAARLKSRVLKDLSDTFRTLEYEAAAIAQLPESELSQPRATQGQSTLLAPGVPRLLQWIAKHQPKYEFLSVKFLREKLFASDPPLQEALQFCIDRGVLELYDHPNPHAPGRTTKACRLNMEHPLAQQILNPSHGG